MASQEFIAWLEVYKTYSGPELDWEIKQLKEQNSIFASQSVGSKSFVRDLGALRDRLQAATRAKSEAGQLNVGASGTPDFEHPCSPLN